LADSLELALGMGNGIVAVDIVGGEELIFSQNFAYVDCGISLEEITPRMFSFNNPYGACPSCDGLGYTMKIDPDLIIANKDLSISEGAVARWSTNSQGWYYRFIEALAKHMNFSLDVPIKELSPEALDAVLYGSRGEKIRVEYDHPERGRNVYHVAWEGIINNFERRYKETNSEYIREEIGRYMSVQPCSDCRGARLRPESLSVLLGGKNIYDISTFSIREARDFFSGLKLTDRQRMIGKQILKEILERLSFLDNVGLDYLTLHRPAGTLSGGEAQRIRLATQIGSSLMGVLYILDEPSIGLHQRDNARLIKTLKKLRDLGNTVLVVEHDEETMVESDYIIDIGPGAGVHGGRVVAVGTLQEVKENENSITGQYLSGKKMIFLPDRRRQPNGKWLEVFGAAEHNLKKIDVSIPLGTFTCITGVSGSGKSTLVNEIIYPALAHKLNRARRMPGYHREIKGIEHLEKVINIDQSPIGRTPRSNPATYTGVFDAIRELFSLTTEAKMRGYKPGRFSFNVKGGRCEACQGDGIIKIEMHFLPDVYIPCEVCKGKRYNRETLDVRYKGKNIADILEMTVDQAEEFFQNIPKIHRKMKTLQDVGLGYIHLGQSATTLSGGEAQRVKLATELSRRSNGRTFYILDEPTTGLHADDIKRLLEVLDRLVEAGDTVLVIEHNLDVIKRADYIIDLGPEGGDRGGEVIAAGTPEEVAENEASYTGHFVRKILERDAHGSGNEA
ncbi:MAG: excinuclease ABC subunit UvrA, partial [Desulfitobacteriaceae bacterium]|nr:excinuclease ABC subunit UvrA [Desulfitobacteriaceae bacterium]